VHLDLAQRMAAAHRLGGQAEVVEQHQRAAADGEGAAAGGSDRCPFHNPGAYPAPDQLGGDQQTGRAGADDQDSGPVRGTRHAPNVAMSPKVGNR
jgi:hypothetical protein